MAAVQQHSESHTAARQARTASKACIALRFDRPENGHLVETQWLGKAGLGDLTARTDGEGGGGGDGGC